MSLDDWAMVMKLPGLWFLILLLLDLRSGWGVLSRITTAPAKRRASPIS